jgi:putative two-component system response regulator
MSSDPLIQFERGAGLVSDAGGAELGILRKSVDSDDPSHEPGVEPATVLVVDDVEVNRRLLKRMLRASGYRIVEARRSAEALLLLESEKIDLIIVELVMPEISGADFCRIVKANRDTRLVPILMVTSVQGVASEIEGISSGADEFLCKPLHPEIVRARVRAMLRNKALIDSLEEAESILFALAQAVEQRDCYTGRHCQRLATYSVALGRALGLDKTALIALHRGGYLHDIGKVALPDRILFKNGKLTEDEWAIMRQHTIRGAEICGGMRTLSAVVPIIRSHHERWDGSGYPDGLAGEEIPLLARVLQIADIYDALTTERPYKPAYSHEEAVLTLRSEATRGWRDPRLVELFAATIREPDRSDALLMTDALGNLGAAVRAER